MFRSGNMIVIGTQCCIFITESLNFKRKNEEESDIHIRCLAVRSERSKGLLGLHSFTGAYWGGKFADISKSRWSMHYISLESSCEVDDVFWQFGEDGFNLDNHARELCVRSVCQE